MENETLLTLFRSRFNDVAGEYIAIKPDADLADAIAKFLADNGITTVVIAGPPLTRDLALGLAGRVDILADFGGAPITADAAKDACSRAGAGISGVDALIADTGTLALASRGPGDRLVSTLPPVHLVVAIDTPIFADLAAFLRTAPTDLTFTFVTGPSRTADIEKVLVRGVHGPVRVVVWGPEP